MIKKLQGKPKCVTPRRKSEGSIVDRSYLDLLYDLHVLWMGAGGTSDKCCAGVNQQRKESQTTDAKNK